VFDRRTVVVSGHGQCGFHLQSPHAVLRCTTWLSALRDASSDSKVAKSTEYRSSATTEQALTAQLFAGDRKEHGTKIEGSKMGTSIALQRFAKRQRSLVYVIVSTLFICRTFPSFDVKQFVRHLEVHQ
jgi:hypothetical protein